MEKPTMFEPYPVAPDVEILPAYFPIPGFGILPMNAFLIRATEPVLVDTGLTLLREEFMVKLSSLIDPGDLRWLWLTHCHPDHIGSLQRVLDEAPKLKVITTFLGAGMMSLFQPLPLDRVYFLNPGQSLSVGDRNLTAIKPPSYDAAETTGLHDPKSEAFFCADCFGALLSKPVKEASEIGSKSLEEGLITWTKADSPWLHVVDERLFAASLDVIRRMSPKMILSGHLPPATNMADELLQYLAAVPAGEPFVGPDQQAMEAMLKEVTVK